MPQPILIEFQTNLNQVDLAIDALEKLGLVDKQVADEFRKTSQKVKEHNSQLDQTGQKTESVKIEMTELIDVIKKVPKKIIDESATKTMTELGNETVKVTEKSVRLTTQLRAMKQEMSQLEIAGKTQTKRYRELQLAAGAMEDQIGDTSQRVRHLASDTRGLDTALGLATGVAGAFSVAQGMAGLFGDENEQLQKTMLKVQSALALVNGLQAVSATLNKDSAVMVNLNAYAHQIYNYFIDQTTGKLIAARVAAVGFASVGLGAIVIGVAYYFQKLNKEVEESKYQFQGSAVAQEDYMNVQTATQKAVYDTTVEMNALLKVARDETKTRAEQNEAIKQLNAKYGDYLGNITQETKNSKEVNEQILRYIELTGLKAKAQAIFNLMVTQNEEYYKGIAEAEAVRNQRSEDFIKILESETTSQNSRERAQRMVDIATGEYEETLKKLNEEQITSNGINKEYEMLMAKIIELESKRKGGVKETGETIKKVSKEVYTELKPISMIIGPEELQTTVIEPSIKVIEDFEERMKAAAERDKQNWMDNIEETRKARAAAWAENVAIAQQALNAISGLSQMALNNELVNLQKQLNSKQISQATYDKRAAEARRKQAVQDKALNVFKALLNIPVAISDGLVKGGIPLSIIYGIIASAEAAAVIGTKIPQFKKGVESFSGGIPGQDSILAMVAPKERIVPADVNTEYFPILSAVHNRKIPASFLNAIAEMPSFDTMAAGLGMGAISIDGQGIDYKKMGEVFGKELSKLPISVFNWDENGYNKSVQTRNRRVEYLNKKYSSN